MEKDNYFHTIASDNKVRCYFFTQKHLTNGFKYDRLIGNKLRYKMPEYLQEIDNFFSGIPEKTVDVLVFLGIIFLFYKGFEYCNFSIEEFKNKLGL